MRVTSMPPPPGGGHPIDGPYGELFWLPIIGPSSLLLVRHIDARLRAVRADHVDVDLGDLAVRLGLGQNLSANGPLRRTLHRLDQFGLAEVHGEHGLHVHRSWPHLSRRQVARLPATVAPLHDAFQRHPGPSC